jgi:site-specific recombinase
MALRSRNLRRVDRMEVVRAVRKRIIRHPLLLLIPPRRAPGSAAAESPSL